METTNNQSENKRDNRFGRAYGGIVLIIIGGLFMARQLGADLPIFSWPMILVAVGLYVGAKHSFRFGGWLIPVAIGFFFLADNMFFDFRYRHLIWPAIIMGIGLFMILRPGRSRLNRYSARTNDSLNSEDSIEATSIFGGTERNIISKDFKGGTLTTAFGGTDLDFSQADIKGTAVIDSTTMFGGIKIVVPPHWVVRSEIVCIAGGIEDKRHSSKDAVGETKTLVLKGTCIFGGIEIKSY